MAHYILKLNENYWDAVMSGDKCFEIRNNDRAFQKGDTVSFTAVNDSGFYQYRNGEKEVFQITYVLPHEWIKSGYVVFGIKALISVGEK